MYNQRHVLDYSTNVVHVNDGVVGESMSVGNDIETKTNKTKTNKKFLPQSTAKYDNINVISTQLSTYVSVKRK